MQPLPNSPMFIYYFFTETEKPILKFTGNCKVSRTAKVILEKKNKAGGLTRSDFKTFYKAAVWFLHKDRYEDQ